LYIPKDNYLIGWLSFSYVLKLTAMLKTLMRE